MSAPAKFTSALTMLSQSLVLKDESSLTLVQRRNIEGFASFARAMIKTAQTLVVGL